MIKIQNRANDGRCAKRRPSPGFTLILVGSVLMGTVLVWLQHSRSDAAPPCQQPLTAQDAVVAGDVFMNEGADIQPGFPRTRLDAAPVLRDALTDWLAASMSGIQRETDPAAQEERMTAWVINLSFPETRSVLNQLQNSSNVMARELSARLARRWAKADIEAASAWAVALADGTFRNAAMEQVSIAWAESNRTEAADWARQLPTEAGHDQAMRVVAEEMVRSEPVEALRLAAELAPSAQRDELVRHAAMEWAGQDAKGAEHWAREIGDAALRSQVLAGIAVALADQDAQTAATLAVNHLPSGRAQADTIVSIINRWVQVDPDAAANWVMQFPAGELKRDAAESLISIWSVQDASRAAQWLSQLPTSLTF